MIEKLVAFAALAMVSGDTAMLETYRTPGDLPETVRAEVKSYFSRVTGKKVEQLKWVWPLQGRNSLMYCGLLNEGTAKTPYIVFLDQRGRPYFHLYADELDTITDITIMCERDGYDLMAELQKKAE